jgi:hypothetical protein
VSREVEGRVVERKGSFFNDSSGSTIISWKRYYKKAHLVLMSIRGVPYTPRKMP